MKSCEKVGEADTAGQISWYSLAEKMQGPIASTDSMIHIRAASHALDPYLAFEIVPAGSSQAGSLCRLGRDPRGQTRGAAQTSAGAFLHGLSLVHSPGWGRGSCITDTAVPDIVQVAQLWWSSRRALGLEGGLGEDQTAEGSTLQRGGKRMACFANSSLIAFFPPPTHPPPQI